jgi:hypothetical protein
VHGLDLAVALKLLGNIRQGDSQRDGEQRQQEDDRKQDEPFLSRDSCKSQLGRFDRLCAFNRDELKTRG